VVVGQSTWPAVLPFVEVAFSGSLGVGAADSGVVPAVVDESPVAIASFAVVCSKAASVGTWED
jgi:hypothetical protein